MNTHISNDNLIAYFSTLGAELTSLKHQRSGREYIWEGNPALWGKHAPVLFPIVGTLKDNQYQYKNKSYVLPRHGFARDMAFEVIQKTEDSVTFSLKADAQTKEKYPFDFELQICYTLEDKSLIISYRVINNTETEMPFSIGGHPAFALPGSFSDYQLQFESDETLHSFVLEQDLLSDKSVQLPLQDRSLPLSYTLFEKDALIIKTLRSRSISILEKNLPLLHFHFDDFHNFGIWTKRNAPFICLEPWLGYSDRLDTDGHIERKEGIQILAPDMSETFTYRIEIA